MAGSNRRIKYLLLIYYRKVGGKPPVSTVGMNAVAALAALERCHGFSRRMRSKIALVS
jgi:hypothetical protein